ncbi:MAG: transcriptional regulator [Pseudomonadota bacterium]|nr:transcriptional regulator [Pseudomonadota bacterium]
MKTNYHHKTLGPLAARLIVTLSSNDRSVFHFRDAEKILGARAPASKVLSQLINHRVVSRLKSGVFRIIPFELGFEKEYLGNPYVVARELALAGRNNSNATYYLSYGSAFELHQMITQPQFDIFISSPKMIRSRTIQGTNFNFVRCKEKDVFGITEIWLDKNEKVRVSDLERTLIDGLKQPAYCGGISEVAKAFTIKRHDIDPQKLIDYALRLGVGAVTRRLGYLMELYEIGSRIHWEFLQTKLTNTYQLLDPELPAEGRFIAKWRLRLNVSPEELLAIGET